MNDRLDISPEQIIFSKGSGRVFPFIAKGDFILSLLFIFCECKIIVTVGRSGKKRRRLRMFELIIVHRKIQRWYELCTESDIDTLFILYLSAFSKSISMNTLECWWIFSGKNGDRKLWNRFIRHPGNECERFFVIERTLREQIDISFIVRNIYTFHP